MVALGRGLVKIVQSRSVREQISGYKRIVRQRIARTCRRVEFFTEFIHEQPGF